MQFAQRQAASGPIMLQEKTDESTEHIDGTTENNLGDHTPISGFYQNNDFASGHRPPPVVDSD